MDDFVRDMLARAERGELHIIPEKEKGIWWARDPGTGRLIMAELDRGDGTPKFGWGREARIEEALRAPLDFDSLAALVGEVRAAYEMMSRAKHNLRHAQDELTCALHLYHSACRHFMEVARRSIEGSGG